MELKLRNAEDYHFAGVWFLRYAEGNWRTRKLELLDWTFSPYNLNEGS